MITRTPATDSALATHDRLHRDAGYPCPNIRWAADRGLRPDRNQSTSPSSLADPHSSTRHSMTGSERCRPASTACNSKAEEGVRSTDDQVGAAQSAGPMRSLPMDLGARRP